MKLLTSILLGLFLVSLFSRTTWSFEDRELQDLRFARAQAYFLKGDSNKALKYLYSNLETNPFHKKTYIRLGKYFFDKGQYTKSFRFYYYAIRKIDGPRFLQLQFFKKSYLKNLKKQSPPKADALPLYFQLSSLYFQIYDQEKIKNQKSIQVLKLAQKYLLLCEEFKYQLGETKLMLGKTYQALNQKEISSAKLAEASSLFEKEGSPKKEMTDLLLAENLLYRGRKNAGKLYLRSVYLSSNSDASLKNYAHIFLEDLEKDYFDFTAFLRVKNKTNLHELTETELSQFSSDQFGEESGLFNEKGISFTHYKNHTSRWKTLSSFYFEDLATLSESSKRKNQREISLSSDLVYQNSPLSHLALRLQHSLLFSRATKESALSNNVSQTSLTPEYSKEYRSGRLAISLPMRWEFSDSNDTTGQFGVGGLYHFYTLSSLWSPTLYLELSNKSEGSLFGSSFIFDMAFTNQTYINSKWSLLTQFQFLSKSNANEALAFNEAHYSLTALFDPELWQGLYVEFQGLYRARSFSNGETMSTSEIGVGLSYTF
jgi:hypothetical protein